MVEEKNPQYKMHIESIVSSKRWSAIETGTETELEHSQKNCIFASKQKRKSKRDDRVCCVSCPRYYINEAAMQPKLIQI